MLDTFFNKDGTIHYEFIPDGQAVNAVHYKEILKQLLMSIR